MIVARRPKRKAGSRAVRGYCVSDVGMAKGGKQAAGKRVTLPDGRNVPMNNGSTGFFVVRPHYFQCTESMKINPVSGHTKSIDQRLCAQLIRHACAGPACAMKMNVCN